MGKTKNKMTEEDKLYWGKLLHLIEEQYFNYDENQHLQKNAILILRGLERGQIIANNKVSNNGSYSLKIIYATFLYKHNDILNAMTKKEFKDESGRMRYICAIVRNSINYVYSKMSQEQKIEKVSEKINEYINTRQEQKKATYSRKTQDVADVNKNKFEEMW